MMRFVPGSRGLKFRSGIFVTVLALAPSMALAAGAGGSGAAAKPDTAKPEAAATAKASAKAKSKEKGAAKGEGDAAPASDTPAGAPPADASPKADLKKSNEALDKFLKKQKPGWSPEGEAQKQEIRKIVGGFLDYGELAKRALAKHWDGLTPAQRTDFVNTLRELVERSYLRQLRGDPNYTMTYEKEERNGQEASVLATLHTTSRNKKVNLSLEYKLVWKNKWLVYDVVTDEQSMLENYRAEFNKIINKDGFDALLKRMKSKLAEKDDKGE